MAYKWWLISRFIGCSVNIAQCRHHWYIIYINILTKSLTVMEMSPADIVEGRTYTKAWQKLSFDILQKFVAKTNIHANKWCKTKVTVRYLINCIYRVQYSTVKTQCQVCWLIALLSNSPFKRYSSDTIHFCLTRRNKVLRSVLNATVHVAFFFSGDLGNMQNKQYQALKTQPMNSQASEPMTTYKTEAKPQIKVFRKAHL